VPNPLPLDAEAQALWDKARLTLQTIDSDLAVCHFREAVRAAMTLAQEANRYLEVKSPWKAVAQDREATGTSLYVALGVISCLKTALYPFLPFSSARLHNMLGFEGPVDRAPWEWQLPEPGKQLPPPQPLFTKLEGKALAEELARLGKG
jgi:methionyl-tRNA synthetase